jgi:RimJ/RimL family protein N-acetyltransferase
VEHDLELHGADVSLIPLAQVHAAPLAAVVDAAIWEHNADEPPSTEGLMSRVIDGAVADPTRQSFAVIVEGRPVGSTSFYEHSPVNARIEIGYTFYGRDVWGGSTNPASKRLLLAYAFDELAVERVALRCAGRNAHSAAAITKLGATREGVLRSHRVRYDGERDDTVYFSILAAEWPDVRQRLDARLAAIDEEVRRTNPM